MYHGQAVQVQRRRSSRLRRGCELGDDRLDALVRAFRMYQEQVRAHGDTPALDFTRAATLVKFVDGGMLQLTACSRCTGRFVSHAGENAARYVCVLCRPPSRAGKKKRVPPPADGESA